MMNSKNSFTLSRLSIGDDYIGTESCMDLQNDIEVQHSDACKTNGGNALKSGSKKKKKKEMREFPPPIPLLLSSNKLDSQVPWALKRYYTTDGRLILKEEKVKQHCDYYFRAHRSNGRLTLQFVDEEEDAVADLDEEERDNNGQSVIDGPSDKTSVDEVPMENDECGETNSLNCNIARPLPSCIPGVPVHSVRTVHG